jgi:hypothetical protein
MDRELGKRCGIKLEPGNRDYLQEMDMNQLQTDLPFDISLSPPCPRNASQFPLQQELP